MLKRVFLVLVLVLAVGMCQSGEAAISTSTPTYGTVTLVQTPTNLTGNHNVLCIAWVCDATGRATFNVTGFTSAYYLMRAEFAGLTTPTASYDITINTKYTSPAVNGGDILVGEGANLANTTDQTALNFQPQLFWCPTLTVAVTNAGNAKSGYIWLMLRKPGASE